MRIINLLRKSRFSVSHANSLAKGRAKAIYAIAFSMLAVFSLASCSSDPEWADPEAHEKTVQLQKQYGPLLVGTWHFERIGERQRFFERLTFESDGTLTGLRKWQIRRLVTVDGKETLTDWEAACSSICHLKKTMVSTNRPTGLPTGVARPSQISDKNSHVFSVLAMAAPIPQMA